MTLKELLIVTDSREDVIVYDYKGGIEVETRSEGLPYKLLHSLSESALISRVHYVASLDNKLIIEVG